jgi:hypothetical protein
VPSPIGESAAVQRRVRELAGIEEHQDEEH